MSAQIPKFPMPIITPRLLLRPPQMKDAVVVNQAFLESFAELHQVAEWAKEKPTLQDTEYYIEQAVANWKTKKNEEPYLPILIFDKAGKEFLGSTGFHHMQWNIPAYELGYWLKTCYYGKGLMTEAINALTRYAFCQLKAKKIEIRCDIENQRSQKIAERLCYTLETTLKGVRKNLITGEISDTLVYSKQDLFGLPDLLVSWE